MWSGFFLALLQKETQRRGLAVPSLAHNLIAELEGGVVTLPLRKPL